MIDTSNRWWIIVPLIGALALVATRTLADEVEQAYFVWSEENKSGSRILLSRYAANSWSAPQTVFSDNHLNILPAVAVSPAGELIVIWSAVAENGIKLKYSRGTREPGEPVNWIEQAVLSEKLITNLAPVVVHDRRSAFWVFWSANDGGDDDVYLSRSAAAGWTPQALVHSGNDVPDALPDTGFDQNGDIWVRWDTFVNRQIEQRSAVFKVHASAPRPDDLASAAVDPDTLKKDSETQYALEPPSFFQSRSRATMYIVAETFYPARLFPGNLLQ